jgi:hypothetical protein
MKTRNKIYHRTRSNKSKKTRQNKCVKKNIKIGGATNTEIIITETMIFDKVREIDEIYYALKKKYRDEGVIDKDMYFLILELVDKLKSLRGKVSDASILKYLQDSIKFFDKRLINIRSNSTESEWDKLKKMIRATSKSAIQLKKFTRKKIKQKGISEKAAAQALEHAGESNSNEIGDFEHQICLRNTVSGLVHVTVLLKTGPHAGSIFVIRSQPTLDKVATAIMAIDPVKLPNALSSEAGALLTLGKIFSDIQQYYNYQCALIDNLNGLNIKGFLPQRAEPDPVTGEYDNNSFWLDNHTTTDCTSVGLLDTGDTESIFIAGRGPFGRGKYVDSTTRFFADMTACSAALLFRTFKRQIVTENLSVKRMGDYINTIIKHASNYSKFKTDTPLSTVYLSMNEQNRLMVQVFKVVEGQPYFGYKFNITYKSMFSAFENKTGVYGRQLMQQIKVHLSGAAGGGGGSTTNLTELLNMTYHSDDRDYIYILTNIHNLNTMDNISRFNSGIVSIFCRDAVSTIYGGIDVVGADQLVKVFIKPLYWVCGVAGAYAMESLELKSYIDYTIYVPLRVILEKGHDYAPEAQSRQKGQHVKFDASKSRRVLETKPPRFIESACIAKVERENIKYLIFLSTSSAYLTESACESKSRASRISHMFSNVSIPNNCVETDFSERGAVDLKQGEIVATRGLCGIPPTFDNNALGYKYPLGPSFLFDEHVIPEFRFDCIDYTVRLSQHNMDGSPLTHIKPIVSFGEEVISIGIIMIEEDLTMKEITLSSETFKYMVEVYNSVTKSVDNLGSFGTLGDMPVCMPTALHNTINTMLVEYPGCTSNLKKFQDAIRAITKDTARHFKTLFKEMVQYTQDESLDIPYSAQLENCKRHFKQIVKDTQCPDPNPYGVVQGISSGFGSSSSSSGGPGFAGPSSGGPGFAGPASGGPGFAGPSSGGPGFAGPASGGLGAANDDGAMSP